MSYSSDIPDLVFTTDANGNVIYSDGTKPTTTPTPAPTTGTDKKWWEQVIGVVPALVTAIFGQPATAQTPYPTTPTPATTGSNTNIIIIAVAAIAIVFLLMKKK